MRLRWTLAALAITVVAAQAQVVDGTLDVAYGSALSVQQNATGFGDSNSGAIGTANGSELDAAYGKILGSTLYVFLSGNLESNFNKLDVFISTGGAGQNQLLGMPTDANQNKMDGLTFDTGFNAGYAFVLNGDGTTFFVNNSVFTGTAWSGGFSGSNGYGATGLGALSGGTSNGVQAAINNSNTAGVTGTTATGQTAVTTGIELAIPLAALGNPTGAIKISAFINGGGNDYASNQWLGSLPAGTGNLGGDGAGNFTGTLSGVNLNNFAGNQYFTVAPVPEPTTMTALALGALALIRRRRNRS